MTRPSRFLVRMSVFLAAVLVAAVVVFPPLKTAFVANIALNGLIVAVVLFGIVYNFRQVMTLYPASRWIDDYDRGGADVVAGYEAPRLLAPMATMLGERQGRFSLSTMAMRSLLDGIAARLDESRDLSRYTIGLLVFLGLLGTFWGLLQTVSSIRDAIGGLSVGGGDINAMFADLKRGLEAPMIGMGTAFSSSLFGLAGSLALGFLDLQASQAQNRFYNGLEDWLSERTRLSSGALGGGDVDQSVPVYVQALLEQTAESLENLQRTLARGEESRIAANNNFRVLTDKLTTLTDHMHTEQSLMLNLAETQSDLKPILAKLADNAGQASSGLDETTRIHIRNLDVYVARLIEELATGREEMIQQFRSEIKLLARTIAALADQGER